MPNMQDEKLVREALEEMAEGLQVIDREWRYVYINKAGARQGRKTQEELLGRTMMECYPGFETTQVFRDLEYVMKGGPARRTENEFIYPDGKKCWFEVFVEAHPKGILIHSFDISVRKSLEEQLRHSQKMEAIGQLAGGIAHDFNNMLGIMMSYCEMIVDEADGKYKNIETFGKKILQAIQQSTSLTRQLLAFSRKQVLDLSVVNVNELFSMWKDNLSRALGETVQLKYVLDTKLGNVRIDFNQLQQAILNIFLNARDAMPKGGTLTLETRNVELDTDYSDDHPQVTPGPYVLIAISDTGIGMDTKTRLRIFEPFFTTKPKGRGTGLGLSMVHGFINQSNGHVWVYSEPERGSVFKIYLPRIEGKREDVSASKKAVIGSSAGTERILLVEDDSLLREAYTIALKNAGYEIESAGDGAQGEKLFFNSKKPFDLILTDVVLPKMGGAEMAKKILEKQPDTKIVFMSGYTENSIVHQGVLDTQSILLQKPISIRALLETIRGALDGKIKKGLV